MRRTKNEILREPVCITFTQQNAVDDQVLSQPDTARESLDGRGRCDHSLRARQNHEALARFKACRFDTFAPAGQRPVKRSCRGCERVHMVRGIRCLRRLQSGGLFERMQTQHRQHAQHVAQKDLHISPVGLAQRRFGGAVGVVQRQAFGRASQGNKARRQKLHMCLVELPGCGDGKADGARPEILLYVVILEPAAYRVSTGGQGHADFQPATLGIAHAKRAPMRLRRQPAQVQAQPHAAFGPLA